MDLGLSGLASGFDWRTLVDQLSDIERVPQRRLLTEQDRLFERRNAYSSIETQLSTFQNKVDALADPDLFESRSATSSDEDIATISAETGAPRGVYDINVLNLATSSVWTGAGGVANKLNLTDDVSSLQLSDAAFYRPATSGIFSVNGERVEIATTDTLQGVFDKIFTATGGDVTASYNSTTDEIELASSNEIVLGSANDTSNFLQLARLNNNGTGLVSSSSNVGSVVLNKSSGESNLATTLSDGGAGQGAFVINGVEIEFDASSDAIQDVLNRINGSQAGVSASFDAISGKFMMTNKTTGDLGVTMEDITGNFLAATGLDSSTMARGNNLQYTINGGSVLQSFSNNIDEESSGLEGIDISVKSDGEFTMKIDTDTEKIKSAINSFITDYNSVQSLIDSQTAVETDNEGNVDAAVLAGELEANQIASSLRSIANGQVSGLSTTLDFLNKLGVNSNGDDNTISLTDSTLLDDALQNDLSGLKEFFADDTNGMASKFQSYFEATIGDDGSLITKQNNLGDQASAIDDQIDSLERIVQTNRDLLISRFINMETAQARANQQLQFLSNNLGG